MLVLFRRPLATPLGSGRTSPCGSDGPTREGRVADLEGRRGVATRHGLNPTSLIQKYTSTTNLKICALLHHFYNKKIVHNLSINSHLKSYRFFLQIGVKKTSVVDVVLTRPNCSSRVNFREKICPFSANVKNTLKRVPFV